MIGRLRGTVQTVLPPLLLVDVGGVGYEVFLPLGDAAARTVGETVTIHTHLIVREDAHLLYGFLHPQARELFRLLIRVNGIGAKIALAMLSSYDHATLTQVIENADTAALIRVPGIGKKSAERILVELGHRVPALRASNDAKQPDALRQAADALGALGFGAQEVRAMLADIDAEQPVSRIITLALQTRRVHT